MVHERREGATKGLRVINSVDLCVLKTNFLRVYIYIYIYTVFIHIKAGLKYMQGLKYTPGSAAE